MPMFGCRYFDHESSCLRDPYEKSHSIPSEHGFRYDESNPFIAIQKRMVLGDSSHEQGAAL